VNPANALDLSGEGPRTVPPSPAGRGSPTRGGTGAGGEAPPRPSRPSPTAPTLANRVSLAGDGRGDARKVLVLEIAQGTLPSTRKEWWAVPESNWGHRDFQSRALPTELTAHGGSTEARGNMIAPRGRASSAAFGPERRAVRRTALSGAAGAPPMPYRRGLATTASEGGFFRNRAGLSRIWSNPTPSIPACTRAVTSPSVLK
jgi:hypothetical protein